MRGRQMLRIHQNAWAWRNKDPDLAAAQLRQRSSLTRWPTGHATKQQSQTQTTSDNIIVLLVLLLHDPTPTPDAHHASHRRHAGIIRFDRQHVAHPSRRPSCLTKLRLLRAHTPGDAGAGRQRRPRQAKPLCRKAPWRHGEHGNHGIASPHPCFATYIISELRLSQCYVPSL